MRHTRDQRSPQARALLSARLQATRLRLLGQSLSVSLLAATASLSLAFTASLAALSAGWRGPSVWWALWVLAAAWALWVLFFGLIAPLARYSSRSSVAKLIERRDPELQDALLTSVDVLEGREVGDPELSEALAERVANTISERPTARWAPWSAFRRPAQLSLLTLSVSALWWLADAPRLNASLKTLTEAPELVTHRESLSPLIGDLKLLLTPPAYTGAPPKSLDFGSGDFEALTGTEVLLEATLTKPAREASLLWTPLNPTPLNATEAELSEQLTQATPPTPLSLKGRVVSARFTVSEAVSWRVRLTDEEGVEWVEALSRHLLIRPDAHPKAEITSPEGGLEVNPQEPVTLSLSARDDFGLSGGRLYMALSSAMEHPEEVPLVGLTGERWQGEERIDLQAVEAQGGDTIALWFEVDDNKTTGEGPQKGRSEVLYLKVSSAADKHHQLLDALREHMEVELTSLADRLELTPTLEPSLEGAALTERLLTAWITLRSQSERALEQLSELITVKMAQDELTPKEVYLAFVSRLERYEGALKEEARALSALTSLNNTTPLTPQTLDATQAPLISEVEATVILIEAMLARLALDEMSALAKELKERRAELRELMSQYKRAPSEALKARIKRELERFKRKMQAMREAMQRLQKKLPKEFLNLDGLKSDEVVNSLEQTSAQLDSIEKMLDEGRMDDALKALDEMSEALDAMSQQLQKDQEELHQQTNPELDKALSELMDQTRDLMRAQEEVARDAQAQQEAIDRAQAEALKQAQEGALKALKEKAARMKERANELSKEGYQGYLQSLLDDAVKASDDLERGLEQALLPESIDAARRAEASFGALERSLRSRARYSRSPQGDEASRDKAREGRELSREALEELQQARKALEQAAERAQAQEAARQAQQQAQAQQQGQQQAQQQGQQQAQAQQQGQQQAQQQGQAQASQEAGQQPGGGAPREARGGSPSLSERQGQITEGVQRLRERLEAKRDKTPSLHNVPDEPFDQALKGSREAQQRLSQSPGQGRPGQQQVQQALNEVMEGLKQAKKPSQGQPQQGQGQPQQGQGGQRDGQGRMSQKKVEIPQQGERNRGSLREDLVEAMKDRPTKGYDEQVKAYYESLVR